MLEAQGLAKGWLLALLEDTPLGRAEAVPVSDFAAGAPALCAAVARALGSDDELARLEPGGDLAPLASSAARLAGAMTPVESLEAVEALRGIVWAAIRTELAQDPDPDLVADVAERLQRIGAILTAAAVGAAAGERAPARRADDDAAAPASVAPVDSAEWRAALSEQLEAAGQAAEPLALLLVEIEDAERLRAAGGAQSLASVVRAVRGEVRRPDVIALEEDGRLWLIAPSMSRQGAAGLTRRVLAAVSSVEHRRVPLLATIGVGYFPDDGRDADALAEAAEKELLSAQAGNARSAERGDEPPRPDLRPVS